MKYIIFDIDGTLANTKKVDDRCFIEAFQQTFAIDIRDEKWELLTDVTDWGITEEIIRRELGRMPTQAEFERMIANHVAQLSAQNSLNLSQFNEVEGARDFFYELKSVYDIELGIATGAWERSALLKLNAIGIDIHGISFSNSDYHKSRAAITQDVIRQLHQKTNATPDRIIYFGDGEWDYKTCQELNIDFIGIDVDGSGKLTDLGAKTVFRNFEDKHSILKAIS